MLYYSNIYWGIFLYLLLNYLYDISVVASATIFHKALVMHKIMGVAGSKHVISAMQW